MRFARFSEFPGNGAYRIAEAHQRNQVAGTGNSHGCDARLQARAMQNLARYWGTDYDWRKCEAKLNALPQFITEIDGLDIHFIHVR